MNFIYANGKYNFLKGQINWESDSIKACLLDGSITGYLGGETARLNDKFYSDISQYVLTGTTNVVYLPNRSADKNGTEIGVAVADDITFLGMTGGQTVGYLCVFKDSSGNTEDIAPSNPATSPLILLFDSGYGLGGGTNNGADIVIEWNPDFGLFQL